MAGDGNLSQTRGGPEGNVSAYVTKTKTPGLGPVSGMAGSKVSSGLCPPFLLTALLSDPPAPPAQAGSPDAADMGALTRQEARPSPTSPNQAVSCLCRRLKPWPWVHTVTQHRAARGGSWTGQQDRAAGCDRGPGLPGSCPCLLLSPSRDGDTFPGAHPRAKGQQDTSSTRSVSGTRRLALPHQAECRGGGRWPNPRSRRLCTLDSHSGLSLHTSQQGACCCPTEL